MADCEALKANAEIVSSSEAYCLLNDLKVPLTLAPAPHLAPPPRPLSPHHPSLSMLLAVPYR